MPVSTQKNTAKDEWNAQRQVFTKIYELGMQAYVGTLKNTASAFTLSDHTLRCMDEGTPGGRRIGGSGILLPSLKEAVSVSKRMGVTAVSSHDDCGAAKLYAQTRGCDTAKANEIGKAWSRDLARALNVPYVHISADEMRRPRGLHNARIIYYISTDGFNPTNAEGLPNGFVIERGVLPADYAITEVNIAIGIALGGHGFGKTRFTEKTPLIISPVGNPAEGGLTVEKLSEELKPVAAEYGGRVIIDGFTAPK